jgi:hypothetical protein
MAMVDESSTIIETAARLHRTVQFHTKQANNLQFQNHDIL